MNAVSEGKKPKPTWNMRKRNITDASKWIINCGLIKLTLGLRIFSDTRKIQLNDIIIIIIIIIIFTRVRD